MSRYGNLDAAEKAKIEFKLSELGERTGQMWTYNIMDKRGEEEISPLLEIIVDGRIFQPIVLPIEKQCPATVICDELESHAENAVSASDISRYAASGEHEVQRPKY